MMHWYQSTFQTMEMVPTRVDAPGVRSTCIWAPCQNPDCEIALVSNITYASSTEMKAAYVKGDTSVMATIQKVRQAGMGEDLTVEDYVDGRSYAESTGFGGRPAFWKNMLPQQVLCCQRRKQA